MDDSSSVTIALILNRSISCCWVSLHVMVHGRRLDKAQLNRQQGAIVLPFRDNALEDVLKVPLFVAKAEIPLNPP